MNVKITKRAVDAARPTSRDTFLWDTEVKGFGLKATPAGNRIYVLQARLNGRLRRWTIGKHGSPITPDEARDKAIQWLGMIAKGDDPSEAEAKRDQTIAQLCDTYLAEGCEQKKASTLQHERGLIKHHIKPLLGRRPVKSLVRADIERFMTAVAAGKTAASC